MAGNGTRRGPLVADRRYSAAPAKPKPSPKSNGPKPGGTKPPRKPRKARPKRNRGVISGTIIGFFTLIWRIIWGIGWRIGAVGGILLGLTVFYFFNQLPPLAALLDGRARGSVTLLDREGKTYAWRGETFGEQSTSETVSPHLRNAVVAAEDKRFYGHFGVSPRGIAGAIKINLSEGRGALSGNGGSTLTQQVAKLLCLGVPYDAQKWATETKYEDDCRSGGVTRKIKEIPFAMAMEAKYSKAEILTIYLNRAYMGAGARGFEAAAQRYFGKSAANVNVSEAAMLAGLLPAPSRYAPTNNLKRSQDRAATVVKLMWEQGFLTTAERDEAWANPATLSQAAQARAGGYFADWVMESGPDFLTTDTTEDVIIRTTLDQRIQSAAEAAIRDVFDAKVKDGSKAEAAVVIMSADGAVRAMVGGRTTQVTGAFNRATHAKRQTGSTFKPFVYAAALDLGYTPDTIVEDAPLTINVKGSGPWSPQNYTKNYMGPIPLWKALANSVNTSTVRVSEAVGLSAVKKVATDFGFASNLADGPAVALGVSESSLLEMTGAFSGILNGGSSVTPYGLVDLRFKGDDQPLIAQTGGIGERVISEKAARELIWMMSKVVTEGSGKRAALADREVAGKTGTTQAARDAWFIGFTGDYVTGIWMGNDDNTPLKGVTGGGLPAEIWHEVMVRVTEGTPVVPLPKADPSEWRQAPAPTYAGETYTSAPAGNNTSAWTPPADPQPTAPTPPPAQEPDMAERILMEVLGAITGKN